MELELVDFSLAQELKEVGFKELCFYYYEDEKLKEPYLENGSSTDTDFRVDLEDLRDNYNYLSYRCNAPYLEEAKMWFREVHEIDICINPHYKTNNDIAGFMVDVYIRKVKYNSHKYGDAKDTYNQALSSGLKEACKLIKNQLR